MAVIYRLDSRRVIPNWRDFKRTLELGELESYVQEGNNLKFNIKNVIEDYDKNKTLGSAADLINASYISNISDYSEIQDAINFINGDNQRISPSLKAVTEILNNNPNSKDKSGNSILELDIHTIEQFKAFVDSKTLNRLIHRTRNISKTEMLNPIIWVELARLYSMKGLQNQAGKAILNALSLAPNNRFVLRSATRYFIHNNEFEKAIYYLRKSSFIKKDPWLISAHIATSNILGRFSPFIKNGIEIIDSNNYSNFDITELSSSLGTLEYFEGTFKKAKSFFNKSILCPNDNSLAQLEWISNEDERLQINPFNFQNVRNPFEAYAFEFYQKGNWAEAFKFAIKWFLDMPFSKRPILLGTYLSGILMKDLNTATFLTQVGLNANPNDPTLLNNMVYFKYLNNDFYNLEDYIQRLDDVDIESLSVDMKITMQATFGLISMRENDFEKGINYYETAIDNSRKIKNDFLEQLAIINFTRELVRSKLKEQVKYLELLKNLNINPKDKDLILQRNDVISLLKK